MKTNLLDQPDVESPHLALTCLNDAWLDDIITELDAAPDEHSSRIRLKTRWPDLTVIFCSEDDLPERQPFWQAENFDLHLMAASMGCSRFTLEPSAAAGVVVAFRENE